MKLFTPLKLGAVNLANRVVMAPMTRNRAVGNLPNEMMVEYYSQRAGAGLIITEGTSPSPNGLGYARIPGIHSTEQRDGWKPIAKAVHDLGGMIFIQLMHSGRVVNRLNLPPTAEPLAPSPVRLSGNIWTDIQGEQPFDTPREMTQGDIEKTIGEYAKAAHNAISAGIDGIEIHCANGYLINQFLDPGSNVRADGYGIDAAGRNLFAIEVATAVVAEIGADRVGIRISPFGVFNDMSGSYDGITGQYVSLAAALGKLRLSYIHLVDHSAMGAPKPEPAVVSQICHEFRKAGGGAVILSGGYDRDRAEADIESGAADLVAYGRPFISNPDLVARLKSGAPLAPADQTTFYASGPAGYIDYPAMAS